MSDNIAVLDGFTKQLMGFCAEADMFLLVKPDTDLDSRFKAWNSDDQEFVYINGWLWTFEEMCDETGK